jgi:hypothetical protein
MSSSSVDIHGAFKGEGEDMIAALIAASAARPGDKPPARAAPGNGAGTFDVDAEVIKEKKSFERELVPFDFGDQTCDASVVTAPVVPVAMTPSSLMRIPTPKLVGEVKPANGEEAPTSRRQKGKKKSKDAVKTLPTPRTGGKSKDPAVRANEVCAPQKPALTAEQQAAVLNQVETTSGRKQKGSGKGIVATNDERWANSSFQNAPAPDQLPMPSFLKDMAPAPAPVVEPKKKLAAPLSGGAPANAAGLKNLLGMSAPVPVPPVPEAPAQNKGQQLFNNILSSAQPPAPSPTPQQHQQQPMPPPGMMPPPPGMRMPQYPPQNHPPPVQQKLNAIFGVSSQPPQPFPPAQPYPTAPETSGGNFQMLMSKLSHRA